MISVNGLYYFAKSARSCRATLTCDSNDCRVVDDEQNFASWRPHQIKVTSPVAGVRTEVVFPDGSYFEVADASFRWPNDKQRGVGWLAWLEASKLAIISALIAAPVLVWLIYRFLIPAAAQQLADIVPDSVIQVTDQHVLKTLESTAFSDTQLTLQTQQDIRQQFNAMLAESVAEPSRYQLYFYDSSVMGANAIALAGGSIVVTDDLVQQLHSKDGALSAVLLHEIGHVEHRHVVKHLAHSASVAIVLAFVVSDMEALGELIIGAGSTLLDLSFSRTMESEADAFAQQRLHRLGLPEDALIRALQAIGPKQDTGWDDYLSSHPSIADRIQQVTPR